MVTRNFFRVCPPNFFRETATRGEWREMKRQHPEAAGDRLALADQSEPAQPNGKARALPACDGKTVNHDGSSEAEEAALHVARTPEAQAAVALPPPMTAPEAVAFAEAEGLTLSRSANPGGFRAVVVRLSLIHT